MEAVDPLVMGGRGGEASAAEQSTKAARWFFAFLFLITILGLAAGALHWSMRAHKAASSSGLDAVSDGTTTSCELDSDTAGKIVNIEAIVGQTFNWVGQNLLPSSTLVQTIKDALFLTLNTLLATTECTPILAIPAGGLVINAPGCWRTTKQFVFNETDSAMITILAQDVEVNLGGFLHRLGNASAGVIVGNVSRTVIHNGGFRLLVDGTYTDDVRSRGVLAYGPQGSDLRLLYLTFAGVLRAIDVYDVDNVWMDHGRFAQHKGFDGIHVATTDRAAPITLSGVTNAIITEVRIRDSIVQQGEPMLLSTWSIGARTSSQGNNVTNLRIENVVIENAAGISMYGATNVHIKDLLFTVTDDSYGGNFIETGFGTTGVTTAKSKGQHPTGPVFCVMPSCTSCSAPGPHYWLVIAEDGFVRKYAHCHKHHLRKLASQSPD